MLGWLKGHGTDVALSRTGAGGEHACETNEKYMQLSDEDEWRSVSWLVVVVVVV